MASIIVSCITETEKCVCVVKPCVRDECVPCCRTPVSVMSAKNCLAGSYTLKWFLNTLNKFILINNVIERLEVQMCCV